MSSIIEGYNYDIFISYRQKDNRHDGWVTDFVDNLKGELESTFKEEISVYFDINPHDGLLETHDVDASLQDKLKCLIFIPIISRTYCDPRSFAWEHEFKAFIKMASEDQIGLKVRLPNGNVASRLIPVQIHDLYPEDKALVEREIGGFLRPIEFIYKEPGVNRPLRSNEDRPNDNLNKTFYRNQVNKVANAIEEVVHSLKGLQAITAGRTIPSLKPKADNKEESKLRQEAGETIISKKTKKWLIPVLSVALLIAVVFGIFKIIQNNKQNSDISKLEKSIAVLPFVNDSPDQDNTYFINGIMDEILNNLQKIKDFRVLSRTSTEQYRGSAKPAIPRIAKDLDVNYIVEGSGQKYGKKFVLRVQLIAAKNEKHLWGDSFEREVNETSDIIELQSQIAQTIAGELKATITPDEKVLIEKRSTTSLTAYDFYQRGREEQEKFMQDNKNTTSLRKAEDLYKKALESDPGFAPAYTGLAFIYWFKHSNENYFSDTYLDSVLVLCDKALSLDNQLSDGYYLKGCYYFTINESEKAIDLFDKAIKFNPNNWWPYFQLGYIYLWTKIDLVKALENFHKANSIYRGVYSPWIYSSLAYAYLFAGFVEESRNCFKNAFELDRDTLWYYYGLSDVELTIGKYENAVKYLEKAYKIDSTSLDVLISLASNITNIKEYGRALKYYEKGISLGVEKRPNIILAGFYASLGWTYLNMGEKSKAEYFLSKQLEYTNKQIETGRTTNSTTQKYWVLASVYAIKGDRDKLYENLRLIDRLPIISYGDAYTLRFDSTFNRYRNDPEFQQILTDMESKYQAEHERVRKWLEEQGKL